VKTDRRDATKLGAAIAPGSDRGLGPNQEHEALRDLVRARETASRISCGAAPAQQIPVTPRPTSPWDQGVDPEVSGLG